MVQALKGVSRYTVLHFTNLYDAFSHFENRETQWKFVERLKMYGGPWGQCYRERPLPGHVWYDFFFDQVPFKDRFSRERKKPWFPWYGEKPYPS
ncbi:MAG: hypothetical protein AAFW66_16375 [Pseudomonadota bacterium]